MINMNSKDFWENIESIINEGFSPEGLQKLDYYADLFKSGRWIFKRFSPTEQFGCAKGGSAHVIATILAGAETTANSGDEKLSDFKRELKQAAQQNHPNRIAGVILLILSYSLLSTLLVRFG